MFTRRRRTLGSGRGHAQKLKPYLSKIKPMPAVFDRYYVKRLDGKHVKKGKNKLDLAEQLRVDIRAFKKTVNRVCDDLVRVDRDFPEADGCSQEPLKLLRRDWRRTTPDCAFADLRLRGDERGRTVREWRADLTVDVPAMVELSKQNAAPVCGKDFKTGQTL